MVTKIFMMENVIKYHLFLMPNDNNKVPSGKNKIILPAMCQNPYIIPQVGPPFNSQEKFQAANVKDSTVVVNKDAAVIV